MQRFQWLLGAAVMALLAVIGISLAGPTFVPATPVTASQMVYYASRAGCKGDSDLSIGGGTDDTAALQALFNKASNGTPVRIVLDGRSLISGTLTYYGNTEVDTLPGCGLFLKAGSNVPMFMNAHPTNGTIVDKDIVFHGGKFNANGVIGYSSGTMTVTASTKTYTRAAGNFVTDGVGIGDYIVFANFSNGGNNGEFVVTGVTTTAVTVATGSQVNESNQAATVWSWNHQKHDANGQWTVGFSAYGVDHLVLEDVEFDNTRTFAYHIADFTNLFAHAVRGIQQAQAADTNTDGFHLNGPGQWASVVGLRMQGWDDQVAITSNDINGLSPYVVNAGGVMSDILVSDILVNNSLSAVRISSDTSLVDRVTIRGVKGVITGAHLLLVAPIFAGDGNIGNITLDDADVVASARTIELFSSVKQLTLHNIKRKDAQFNEFLTQYSGTIGNLVVDKFQVYDTSNSNVTPANQFVLQGKVNNFLLSNAVWKLPAGGAQASGAVFIHFNGGTIDNLIATNNLLPRLQDDRTKITVLETRTTLPDLVNMESGITLKRWYKPEGLQSLDGSAVKTWKDATGQSDLIATGSPTLKAASWNGYNGVTFSTGAYFTETGNVNTAQPLTIFVVTTSTTNYTSDQTLMDGTTSRVILHMAASTGATGIYAGATLAGSSISAGCRIWEAVVNGGSSTLYLNGTSFVTGAAGSSGLGTMRVGADIGAAGPWLGTAFEILVFAGSPTAQDRAIVRNYLNDKYQIF